MSRHVKIVENMFPFQNHSLSKNSKSSSSQGVTVMLPIIGAVSSKSSSISNELGNYYLPTSPSPLLIENHVANTILEPTQTMQSVNLENQVLLEPKPDTTQPSASTQTVSKPNPKPKPVSTTHSQHVRTHQMVTRSHNNIYKPKQLNMICKHPIENATKPHTVSEVLNISHGERLWQINLMLLFGMELWNLLVFYPSKTW